MHPSERIRLSELLGLDVHDEHGEHVGAVIDVRLVQDGPPAEPAGLARLRVHGLIVSPRHSGRLLGYERSPKSGPWLVRQLVLAYNKGTVYVPWTCVGERDDHALRLTVPARELPPLEEVPAPGGGA
jgi:sporulation protein YlmC with PRC-barrel domain